MSETLQLELKAIGTKKKHPIASPAVFAPKEAFIISTDMPSSVFSCVHITEPISRLRTPFS